MEHEVFQLRMGNITIEEHEKKFLELLRYVGYIKEENVKIQKSMSGYLAFHKDKI